MPAETGGDLVWGRRYYLLSRHVVSRGTVKCRRTPPGLIGWWGQGKASPVPFGFVDGEAGGVQTPGESRERLKGDGERDVVTLCIFVSFLSFSSRPISLFAIFFFFLQRCLGGGRGLTPLALLQEPLMKFSPLSLIIVSLKSHRSLTASLLVL